MPTILHTSYTVYAHDTGLRYVGRRKQLHVGPKHIWSGKRRVYFLPQERDEAERERERERDVLYSVWHRLIFVLRLNTITWRKTYFINKG